MTAYLFMTQSAVIEKLKSVLPNFPIKKAWLFGSFSTDDASDDSDIDLLVDYDKNDDFSLFTIGRVICGLSNVMNRRVDVVENGRLMSFAQKNVDATKILIYERGT